MYTAYSHDIKSAAECDDSSMLVLRNWGAVGMPVTLHPQLTFCHLPQVKLPPKENHISYI